MNGKYFETRDMYLASSLLSYGASLVGSRNQNGTVLFNLYVADSQLLDKLNDDFDSCNLYVNVKRYTKAISEIRHELNKHK